VLGGPLHRGQVGEALLGTGGPPFIMYLVGRIDEPNAGIADPAAAG
jgi:hypothetical protein